MSQEYCSSWLRVLCAALRVAVRLVPLLFIFISPAKAQDASSTSSSPAAQEESLFQQLPSVYEASKYQLPVHGASKEDQTVAQAPSSITVVTANEIQKYGYRTLADILQSVNGFFVTNDRNYSYLGIRGFNRPSDYNSRVLLLVDGHRLNDNVYDNAEIGTEAPLDVDLIDRVEIIRGPSSSLYGANAFFGVINVITKRGRDVKGPEFSAEMGSYESYKGRFTYGNRFASGAEVLFSGSFYDSIGHRRLFYQEFNDPATNRGIATNADGDRLYHLFTKSSLADLTLQGSYTYRQKYIPTGAYGTVFNNRRDNTVDEHGYVDLAYDSELTRWLRLSARTYYDRYYYHGQYLYDYGDNEQSYFVLNQDTALGESWGGEIKGAFRLFNKHRLTVGGEFRDNLTQNQKNADIISYVNAKKSSAIWALYVQDEFSLFENLQLNVGFRHDHYSSFGGTTNPRIGLVYTLKKTALKLLYGEAFRAPNAFELFFATGDDYKANPHLKPETIRSYEVVAEYTPSDHLRASVAGYYYTLNGLISQTLDPADERLVFRNAASIKAKGLEFELNGHWASGLEGRLGYAIQEARSEETGNLLTNSPQHMVKFSLIIPLLHDRLFAGLETRYMSERSTLSGKPASGLFVTNLTFFGQQLFKGTEITASINNLFDQRYGDPGSEEHRQRVIPQDGRTFWLKLKYNF